MLETHPFRAFTAPNAKYLILGSFAGKGITAEAEDWFYTAKRNQFWWILEMVYNVKLDKKEAKQKLFSDLRIAITDIIYQCERAGGNNSDTNLINCRYNLEEITQLLRNNRIAKIFFTSHFVKDKFNRHFKDLSAEFAGIEQVLLPSPSPRYARKNKLEKVEIYKDLLPKLPT